MVPVPRVRLPDPRDTWSSGLRHDSPAEIQDMGLCTTGPGAPNRHGVSLGPRRQDRGSSRQETPDEKAGAHRLTRVIDTHVHPVPRVHPDL